MTKKIKMSLSVSFTIFLFGCATPQDIKAPYMDIPTTCTEIQTEIDGISEDIAIVVNIRTVKELAILLIPLSVAFGAINPAFAILPPIVNGIQFPTKRQRLDFLSHVQIINKCVEVSNE